MYKSSASCLSLHHQHHLAVIPGESGTHILISFQLIQVLSLSDDNLSCLSFIGLNVRNHLLLEFLHFEVVIGVIIEILGLLVLDDGYGQLLKIAETCCQIQVWLICNKYSLVCSFLDSALLERAGWLAHSDKEMSIQLGEQTSKCTDCKPPLSGGADWLFCWSGPGGHAQGCAKDDNIGQQDQEKKAFLLQQALCDLCL